MISKLIEQYKILHSKGVYGTSSEKLYDDILPLLSEVNHYRVLDYGCGQSNLINMLPIPCPYKYDPAIEEYNKWPPSATVIDLVICTDVLEHIPEEQIKDTLEVIRSFSKKVIFSIAVVPSVKQLPNGDNAHCTVQPKEWWIEKIVEIFEICNIVKMDRNVKFICKTW